MIYQSRDHSLSVRAHLTTIQSNQLQITERKQHLISSLSSGYFACVFVVCRIFQNQLFQKSSFTIKPATNNWKKTSNSLFAYLVILHAFFAVCWIFSKSTFSNNYFRNIISVSNRLNPDQARRFVGPDLGPNCLQRLSADDTCWQRIKPWFIESKLYESPPKILVMITYAQMPPLNSHADLSGGVMSKF